MNPQIRETLDWLNSQGLPPLPIAPVQDAEQYPTRNRDGSLKQDKDGTLMPAFTGKNPSYLDVNGIPHLVRHTQYQHRLPTNKELQTWFANPANGIGTLGGWHGVVWIDIDLKQFESQEACDRKVTQWLTQYPLLRQTFTERTQSGGWRFAVRVREKTFTNFSLNGSGGKHMGEALGQGRVTVLAPTIGPSGNPYINLRRASPVWVERLEAIGLYSVSQRRARPQSAYPRRPVQSLPAQPGVLRLEDLAAAKAQAVLHGDSPFESRSHSLAFALQEFYGWENWAAQNRVPISGNPEDLARAAGAALGIDCDRIERIIQSIPDPANCLPATVFAGGDLSAWKRIWTLDQQVYFNLRPGKLRKRYQPVMEQSNHKVYSFVNRSKLQHQQDKNLSLSPESDYSKPDSGISIAQLQRFIEYARYILANANHPTTYTTDKQSPTSPTKCIQGRIYRIVAKGTQLSVQTVRRGTILQAQGSIIKLSQLSEVDLKRFQGEVRRIQQQTIVSKLIQPIATYDQIIERQL